MGVNEHKKQKQKQDLKVRKLRRQKWQCAVRVIEQKKMKRVEGGEEKNEQNSGRWGSEGEKSMGDEEDNKKNSVGVWREGIREGMRCDA